jgi:hypothetical protein
MKLFITILLSLITLTSHARSKVNVIVDERMELLTVIQYLSGYPILTQADLKYKKEIENYFRDYRDHPAVALHRNIYERMFGFDAPVTYIYHFSFPGFKQIADFSGDDLRTYEFDRNRDTLSLLMESFKDFYKKTDFHKFYTSHSEFYDSLTAPVIKKIEESRVIDIMEQHYGAAGKEYNVVLVPMLHDGGYGPKVKKGNGQIVYAIIGPKGESIDIPEFDVKILLSEYVIHEFSHSFCNPFIAKNLSELQKDRCLLEPIKKSMEEQGYGNWEACLYEHFTRANEILITEKLLGRQKAADLMDNMIRNDKWIYLHGLVDVMRKYQEDRKKYKTLNDIMPEVISYFHEAASKCQ